jgi:FixJ family two-component response regulator
MVRLATIYVIDDDDGVRESLRMLLEADDFASGEELVRAGRPDQQSCLVLDIHTPCCRTKRSKPTTEPFA